MYKLPLFYYGTQYGPGLTLGTIEKNLVKKGEGAIVHAIHPSSDAYGRIFPGDIILNDTQSLNNTVCALKGPKNTTVEVGVRTPDHKENLFLLKRRFK